VKKKLRRKKVSYYFHWTVLRIESLVWAFFGLNLNGLRRDSQFLMKMTSGFLAESCFGYQQQFLHSDVLVNIYNLGYLTYDGVAFEFCLITLKSAGSIPKIFAIQVTIYF
jgi:hypothetical protein